VEPLESAESQEGESLGVARRDLSNMEISSSKIGVAVVDLRTKTDKMQQILFVGM
jgi:hypothetical protein